MLVFVVSVLAPPSTPLTAFDGPAPPGAIEFARLETGLAPPPTIGNPALRPASAPLEIPPVIPPVASLLRPPARVPTTGEPLRPGKNRARALRVGAPGSWTGSPGSDGRDGSPGTEVTPGIDAPRTEFKIPNSVERMLLTSALIAVGETGTPPGTVGTAGWAGRLGNTVTARTVGTMEVERGKAVLLSLDGVTPARPVGTPIGRPAPKPESGRAFNGRPLAGVVLRVPGMPLVAGRPGRATPGTWAAESGLVSN